MAKNDNAIVIMDNRCSIISIIDNGNYNAIAIIDSNNSVSISFIIDNGDKTFTIGAIIGDGDINAITVRH